MRYHTIFVPLIYCLKQKLGLWHHVSEWKRIVYLNCDHELVLLNPSVKSVAP